MILVVIGVKERKKEILADVNITYFVEQFL